MFYISDYQSTQKWLKDRKGRVLGAGDVKHCHKIIKALVETDKIMKEIKDWTISPLTLNFCTNLVRLFEEIPETPMYTGFIRDHFEIQLLWCRLVRVRMKVTIFHL